MATEIDPAPGKQQAFAFSRALVLHKPIFFYSRLGERRVGVDRSLESGFLPLFEVDIQQKRIDYNSLVLMKATNAAGVMISIPR